MTTRENLMAALNGDTPEQTPLSIYDWFFTHPRYELDAWHPLFDQGLGLCLHCSTAKLVEHGVKDTVEYKREGDRRYAIRRKETSVGTLQSVTINSTSVPQYDEFARTEEKAGDCGVTVVGGGRTPAMSIQVDYAGEQRFALDVALEVDELLELYEAEKRLFTELIRVIADGPGRFVKWNEFTSSSRSLNRQRAT